MRATSNRIKAALGTIPATVADVRKLTADNPDQQRRITTIAPLIDTKLAELKGIIELRRNQGFDAAAKIVADQCRQNPHGPDPRARR